MRFVALVCLALGAQSGTGEEYYKLPKGTLSTFKISAPEMNDTLLVRVTESGDKVLTSSEAKEKRMKASPMMWFVSDGILFWGENDKGESREAVAVYKPGAKKGDVSTIAKKPGILAQEWTLVGNEDVTVAAGTYKGALHTRTNAQSGREKITMDFFLAPKTGIVKMIWNVEGMALTFDLTAFELGK